jgi:hypothetical protein
MRLLDEQRPAAHGMAEVLIEARRRRREVGKDLYCGLCHRAMDAWRDCAAPQ